MKVVISAECPFLVVQKDTKIQEIKNIAVPIDLTKESLQIVNIAGDMANMLNSKVHVLAEKQSDQILNQRLQNRLGIVKGQYEDRSNDAEVYILKKRKFAKRIINHVKTNDCGMIAISYHTERLFPQFDNFAPNLMMNKQGLPFLVINSKLASSLYF
jgi:K+-sensing histidine kinase KdpD